MAPEKEWLEGRELVRYLRKRGMEHATALGPDGDWTVQYQWRRGAKVRLSEAEPLLIALDIYPTEFPRELWTTAPARATEQPAKPIERDDSSATGWPLARRESRWLAGPPLVAWLKERGLRNPDKVLGDTGARAVRRWAKGSRASFWAADQILMRLGLHLSEVPDNLWTTAPWLGQAAKARQEFIRREARLAAGDLADPPSRSIHRKRQAQEAQARREGRPLPRKLCRYAVATSNQSRPLNPTP